MVNHIVTWNIKEKNKETSCKKMKEMLEALPAFIPEIKFLQVGINENGEEYDAILITRFDSYDDWKTYDVHPEHQKVRAFIKTVTEGRIVVDFTE